MIRVAYGRHFSPTIVVQQCAASLGDVAPLLLVAFCGGKHDPEAILAALHGHFPGVRVVGGSAAGALWNGGFGYSGLELALLVFVDQATLPAVFTNHGLLEGERAAGLALGAEVARAAADDSVVFLLFDSVAAVAPLRLHPASTIVDGFTEGLGDKMVRLIGGGTLTDMNLSDGWIFDGEKVCKHALVALVFPSNVTADVAILHGCRPVSTFMEITRIDGAEVYELDGQPALHVIERMLGLPLGGSAGQELTLIATLGQKQGDPFAPFDENAYVNRLIVAANRNTGSITLFEPDFGVGTRVQIMARDNSLMLESVRHGVTAINRAIAGHESLFALYIDCAGRASARSGSPIEEADVVRSSLDPSVPLIGFYSGVEVAPFEGYSLPLDWTGVLAVLRYRP